MSNETPNWMKELIESIPQQVRDGYNIPPGTVAFGDMDEAKEFTSSALGNVDMAEAENEFTLNSDDVELIVVDVFAADAEVESRIVFSTFKIDTKFGTSETLPINVFTLTDPRLVGLLPSKALAGTLPDGSSTLLLTFYYNKSLPPAARALGKSQPNIGLIYQFPGETLRYDKTLRVFIDNQLVIHDGSPKMLNVVVFGDDQFPAIEGQG